LFGKLPTIFSAPFEVYNKYSNLKGIGVTAESINNNEYIYSALLDLAWRNPKQPVNQAEHLAQFIRRRYGPNRASATVQSVFSTLSKTVWDAPEGQLSQSKSFVEKVPDLNMYTSPDAWLGTLYNYNKTEVVGAWTKLVQAALVENQSNVPKTFKFDLVDLTREVLLGSTVLPALHKNLVDAYTAKDIPKIRAAGRQMVALITDINTLLNTHRLFSFGANVRDAHESIDPIACSGYVKFPASANGPSKDGYQQFLESNARDLVTWWGPNSGDLADYASKQWGGLLTSYYLPRWTLFIKELEQAVAAGKEWDRAAYIATTLVREAGWQKEVWGSKPGESWETNGQEPMEVVRELYNKWGVTAIRVAAGGKA
jgi:alpha-N-acetylglucosaminidase